MAAKKTAAAKSTAPTNTDAPEGDQAPASQGGDAAGEQAGQGEQSSSSDQAAAEGGAGSADAASTDGAAAGDAAPASNTAAAVFQQLADTATSSTGPVLLPDEDDDAVDVYEVISPLEHDGKPYAIGKAVQLTRSAAAALLGHTVRLID